MGLLDDAIREHLELKRRHGAADAEVAASEREALGPVQSVGEPFDASDEEPLPSSPDEERAAPSTAEEPPEPAHREPDVSGLGDGRPGSYAARRRERPDEPAAD